MRDLPIFASGTLATSTTKVAHLFELELSRIKVMQAVSIGDTRITVDDVDKCFIGQKLIGTTTDQILEVTAISLILNQITVSPAINYNLAIDSYLMETIYIETPTPTVMTSGGIDYYQLQLWHSAFGTLSGRMLFTDFDVPIVAAMDDDGLFGTSYDNYGVYIPYPIKFNGTGYDTHGKMSNVSLTIANTDQRFSNLVLTHDGFRKRKVKIHSIFLSSATEFNLNVPIQANPTTVIYAGITTGTATLSTVDPVPSMNVPFRTAYFDAADDVVQEFEGFVDSISLDDKTAEITAVNYIDSSDSIMLPRNLYTRGRCQFVYKGNRCRFRSTLISQSVIAATATTTQFLVMDTEGKFPLWEMQPNETHIIQINDEQMLVTAVGSSVANTRPLTQETHHQLPDMVLQDMLTVNPAGFTYILTVTRGYNSTEPGAHIVGDAIDILLCRKTFHDCRLHFHERMFGGFPAVPKQIYNV